MFCPGTTPFPRSCRSREWFPWLKDALLNAGNRVYDAILTNPPFGRKQSYRIMRADGEVEAEREDYDRSDFLQPLPLLF